MIKLRGPLKSQKSLLIFQATIYVKANPVRLYRCTVQTSSKLVTSGTILGIVFTIIGFAGAIYYGSKFVKEETNAGGTLPYTTSSQLKNISPIDLEVGFVVVGVIGFGILIYELANRIDKPLDFYPQ